MGIMRCCWLLAALASACAQPSAASTAPAASKPLPGLASSASPLGPRVKAAIESEKWIDAVRMQRWGDAARLLDSVDGPGQREPAMRFIRARVAFELSQCSKTLDLLEGLDRELPLLQAEILEYRARCELRIGPFEDAAAYFSHRRDPESLARAAEALERAGRLEDALNLANRAVSAASGVTGSERLDCEADARQVRALIAEKKGSTATAASDWRWLCTAYPTCSQASDADDHLERVAPQLALTAAERHSRAQTFAKRGDLEATLRELALVEVAKGPAVPKAELIETKAFGYYLSRSDYHRAAELFQEAARGSPGLREKDSYYAARSLARANEDDRAIEAYKGLVSSYPKSEYAEEARYRSANLYYILARWDDAARSYRDYLERYPKGRFAETARYELAVTFLAKKAYKDASKALRRLSDAGDDASDGGRIKELYALALAGDNDRARAEDVYRSVIHDYPLSFPSLASAARLTELGDTVPPLIESAPDLPSQTPLAITLPPKVALLSDLGLDADAAAALEQQASEFMARYAPRGQEALCEAFGKLSAAEERYRHGQRVVRASVLTHAPSAATQWAWECLYPRPYAPLVSAMESEKNLPQDLVYAFVRQESAFRVGAVSSANAIGLMQLIPPTATQIAEEMGVDRFDPELLKNPSHNLRFGSHYLSRVLERFGGNVALAAAAYNAGPQAVSRWLEHGEELPLDVWVARIPYAETRQYVARILGNVARYAYLRGGLDAVPKLNLAIPKGLRASPEDY